MVSHLRPGGRYISGSDDQGEDREIYEQSVNIASIVFQYRLYNDQRLMNSQKAEISQSSSFRRKPESRVPGENRDPVSKEMVPGVRRDSVWTPAFAGVTLQEMFARSSRFGRGRYCKLIIVTLH